jgi:hypothetical protein
MESLEKRMYFFVIRQLSGLNAGIQIGHANEQYAHNNATDIDYLDFVKNWRTWIVLDGGTTNSNEKDFGSLNQILISLRENKIKHAYFHEPDLNNALTAVCFMADERVFNFEKYTEYETFTDNNDMNDDITYEEWVESIGGEYNLFLRELIKGKRKAMN